MALSDIIAQIKKETDAKMNTLKEEYEKKVKEIDAEFDKLQTDANANLEEKVETNSKKVFNKMVTHAKMEAKNKLLKEKRDLLDVIFTEALAQLAASPNYKDMLVSLLKHSSMTGEGITVCPAKGKEEETKAAISAAGKDYKLCDKSLDIKGGFVLRSEKIEIDNSFESILYKQLRDDVELEVAQSLFS